MALPRTSFLPRLKTGISRDIFMSKTILNADELRSLEERSANHLGADQLMRRAGAAAADLVEARSPGRRVTLLAGPGNNGGDAVACALELKRRGFEVQLVLPTGEPRSELARTMLAEWRAAGGTTERDPYMTEKADCVVDGLFGTGLEKPVSGEALDAVLWFNERQAFKIALDLPSGLNAATGNWVGTIPGCRADVTIAFLAVKAGLYMNEGVDAAGEVVLAELDVSVPLSNLSVVEADEFEHVLAPRNKNSHKGTYGHLAIVGGDRGHAGAALLAARAGLVTGAGTVTAELLAGHGPEFDPTMPELMFSETPVDFTAFTAAVIGPGLGMSDAAKARLCAALDAEKPLVIDADALNLISADLKLQDRLLARRATTILTPHEMEAARMLRRDVKNVTVDRVAAARELAVQSGAIVVLKGPGTVVALRSSRTWINPTGSPMLSTAGSGDVLAGMIGAFLAQKFDAVESVLSAVYLHGLSAEGRFAGFLAGEIAPAAARILESMRRERVRRY